MSDEPTTTYMLEALEVSESNAEGPLEVRRAWLEIGPITVPARTQRSTALHAAARLHPELKDEVHDGVFESLRIVNDVGIYTEKVETEQQTVLKVGGVVVDQ